MNKQVLISNIIAQLGRELEVYTTAARASHAEATHESSKAENKYDTRGLEASYLARGQSKQAAEVAQAIDAFQKLPARDFAASDEIDVGAFVVVEARKERSRYFIGPRAGGTEVVHEGSDVIVITPQSPLGQQLVGRRQGEKLQLQMGGSTNEFRIASVA